jgi:hypothetical protein
VRRVSTHGRAPRLRWAGSGVIVGKTGPIQVNIVPTIYVGVRNEIYRMSKM